MNPTVQAALDNLVSAINAAAGTPAPVATAVPFWRPTDAQATAFATRSGWTIHDLYGSRQGTIQPCDGSDADAELYAAFGFWPTGLRYLWSSDNRESAASLCDKVSAAPTPQAANDIIRGAGDPGVTSDGACYLIMTGNTSGGGLAGTPRVGLGGATTVAEAVKILMGQVAPGPGPGPSGR